MENLFWKLAAFCTTNRNQASIHYQSADGNRDIDEVYCKLQTTNYKLQAKIIKKHENSNEDNNIVEELYNSLFYRGKILKLISNILFLNIIQFPA